MHTAAIATLCMALSAVVSYVMCARHGRKLSNALAMAQVTRNRRVRAGKPIAGD